MRILLRTSKWAIWSRRFASYALPLTIISVLMHRARMISSEVFTLVFALTMLIALLAVLMAIIAFIRLWFSGDQGWSRAGFGFVLGLILFSPVIYAGVLAADVPLVNDVSTGAAGTPKLAFIINPRPVSLAAPDVVLAFPNAVNRSYQIEPSVLFALTKQIVDANGWEIRRERRPSDTQTTGVIHAIVTSWFGWRDEVVIAMAGDVTSAAVTMRSASGYGEGDLGVNGHRIESFLLQLDSNVSDFLQGTLNVEIEPES